MSRFKVGSSIRIGGNNSGSWSPTGELCTITALPGRLYTVVSKEDGREYYCASDEMYFSTFRCRPEILTKVIHHTTVITEHKIEIGMLAYVWDIRPFYVKSIGELIWKVTIPQMISKDNNGFYELYESEMEQYYP